MAMNPIGLIIGLIAVLVAAFFTFRKELTVLWGTIKDFFSRVWSVVSKFPQMMIDAFKEVPKAFMALFEDVGKIIKAVISGDFEKLPDLLKSAGKNLVKTNPLGGAAIKLGKAFAEEFGTKLAENIETGLPGKASPPAEEAGKKVGKAFGKGFSAGSLSTMKLLGIKDTKKLAEMISKAITKGADIKMPKRKAYEINIKPAKSNLQKIGDRLSKSFAVGLIRYALNETKVGKAFKGAGKVLAKMGPVIGKAIGKGLGAAKQLGQGIAKSFTSQMQYFGGTFDSLMSGDYIGAIISIFSEFASASKGFATLMGMINNSMGVIFNKFMPVFDQLTFSMFPLIHAFTEIADIMSGVLMDGLTQLLPPVMDIINQLRTLAPLMELFLLAINSAVGLIVRLVADAIGPMLP
jgi:hypothetical protein